MTSALPIACVGALASTAPHAARAEPGERAIAGEVVTSRARWARGGKDVVTESTVRTEDGVVHLRQLGGTVDGVGMRVSHAPPILAVGDRVELRASVARDLGGRPSLVVAAVDALVRPDAAAPALGGAAGFVRTTNSGGAPVYWDSSCAHIAYAEEGTTHVPGAGEFAVIEQVLDRWRADTEACSYLTFERDGMVTGEVGLDGVNLIKFREDAWCRPATDDDPEECYQAAAAGLTTLFFIDDPERDDDGKIFDADVELNAVNFAIAVDGASEGGQGCASDLANTLTHEIGHLVGLEHTCWDRRGNQPVDDDGDAVPACDVGVGALPSTIRDATMYPFQDCGETKKASPEADDVAGVCAIYPTAEDVGECRRPSARSSDEGGCCAVAGGRRFPAGAVPLALLGVAFAVRLRRRKRCCG